MSPATSASKAVTSLNIAGALLLLPTLLLWMCVFLSLGGIEIGFAAACGACMGGYGGLCFYFAFPVFSFILSLIGIITAKLTKSALQKWSLAIAAASIVLCAIAVIACLRT